MLDEKLSYYIMQLAHVQTWAILLHNWFLFPQEDIEAKSLALFCMVTLLQDDDDEVRKNSANVILDIVNHPYKGWYRSD